MASLNIEENLSALWSALEAARLLTNNEAELQRQIAAVLLANKIEFEREKRLSPGERLDFFLPGAGIAIEAKMWSSQNDLRRQLWRYASRPEVSVVVLIARRPFDLPDTLSGKPIRQFPLWRQAIA